MTGCVHIMHGIQSKIAKKEKQIGNGVNRLAYYASSATLKGGKSWKHDRVHNISVRWRG